jgi:hypothetical protein
MVQGGAGAGEMTKAEREALIFELDKLVGRVNPDGTPHVDPEEVVDPEFLKQHPRPTREKIAATARQLAQTRARRQTES